MYTYVWQVSIILRFNVELAWHLVEFGSAIENFRTPCSLLASCFSSALIMEKSRVVLCTRHQDSPVNPEIRETALEIFRHRTWWLLSWTDYTKVSTHSLVFSPIASLYLFVSLITLPHFSFSLYLYLSLSHAYYSPPDLETRFDWGRMIMQRIG